MCIVCVGGMGRDCTHRVVNPRCGYCLTGLAHVTSTAIVHSAHVLSFSDFSTEKKHTHRFLQYAGTITVMVYGYRYLQNLPKN